MNKSIFARISEFVSPSLETDSPTGSLGADEQVGVIALLETLSADSSPPAARCLRHAEVRTSGQPGYLKAYRDGRVLLELSDATIEELDPTGLVANKDFALTAAVKGGRRRAGFARSVYYQRVARIDMDGGRFVLRLGDEEFEIPCV